MPGAKFTLCTCMFVQVRTCNQRSAEYDAYVARTWRPIPADSLIEGTEN